MLKQFLAAFVIASTTATAAFAEPPAVKAMPEPQMGDHWTYAVRDEITGQAKPAFTQTVTEARDGDVSVRVTVGGRETGFWTFDRQWNLTDNLAVRFSPNDGLGIRTPLAVGQTWTADVKQTNMKGEQGQASLSFSRTVRVVGRGAVTSKAGRFDAFEIENSFRIENGNLPGAVSEAVVRTWYAPDINHWVKRTRETRINGRLARKDAEELEAHGRRESK